MLKNIFLFIFVFCFCFSLRAACITNIKATNDGYCDVQIQPQQTENVVNIVTYEDMKQSISQHDPWARSIIFQVIGFDSGYEITKFVFDLIPVDSSEDEVYEKLEIIYNIERVSCVLNMDFIDCFKLFIKHFGKQLFVEK